MDVQTEWFRMSLKVLLSLKVLISLLFIVRSKQPFIVYFIHSKFISFMFWILMII